MSPLNTPSLEGSSTNQLIASANEKYGPDPRFEHAIGASIDAVYAARERGQHMHQAGAAAAVAALLAIDAHEAQPAAAAAHVMAGRKRPVEAELDRLRAVERTQRHPT